MLFIVCKYFVSRTTFFPQVKFRVSDVQVPDIPGMFTTFKANNVPLFVDGEQVHIYTVTVIPQHPECQCF